MSPIDFTLISLPREKEDRWGQSQTEPNPTELNGVSDRVATGDGGSAWPFGSMNAPKDTARTEQEQPPTKNEE